MQAANGGRGNVGLSSASFHDAWLGKSKNRLHAARPSYTLAASSLFRKHHALSVYARWFGQTDRQTDTSPMLNVFHYESGQRSNFFSSPRMT